MKDKLTLRNVLICSAAFLALLVFIFSFLTTLVLKNSGNVMTDFNIIWGANKTRMVSGGTTVEQVIDPSYGPAVMPLLGTLMVFIGGIAAVVIALLVKDEKIRRICLFVCAGLILVGGVFHFFTYNSYANAVVKYYNAHKSSLQPTMTVQDYLDANKDANPSVALAIVSGILGVLGGAAVCASQFVPDKKLGK